MPTTYLAHSSGSYAPRTPFDYHGEVGYIHLRASQIRLLHRIMQSPRAFKKLGRWAEAIAKGPHILQLTPVLEQKTEPITTERRPLSRRGIGRRRQRATNQSSSEECATTRCSAISACAAAKVRSGRGVAQQSKEVSLPFQSPFLPLFTNRVPASCWRTRAGHGC